jgi:NAD-dependent DNA ligase
MCRQVTTDVSEKTSYLVVGQDPGLGKLKKGTTFAIDKLDEKQFLDLVANR